MGVFDLTGRKALVTGGARGSVPGWRRRWPAAGAAVMIGDLLEEQGRRTAEAITASGATAGFVPLDVTDDDSWASAVPPPSPSSAGSICWSTTRASRSPR